MKFYMSYIDKLGFTNTHEFTSLTKLKSELRKVLRKNLIIEYVIYGDKLDIKELLDESK